MKSDIELHCDFCGGVCAVAYHPQSSIRNVGVFLCKSCGLAQSFQVGVRPAEKRRTTSADADWGNLRHGKGARLAANLELINAHVPLASLSRVLDIGSNRGAFVLWLHTNHPHLAITALEPDASVVDAYEQQPELELILDRAENVTLPAGMFDFVYLSHTLEHAASAAAMLRQSYDALGDSGMMFLEIPNLDAIASPHIVEEYFIDKHSFHFDRDILLSFCRHVGFETMAGEADADPFNVTLLLRKGRNQSPFGASPERVERNRKLIKEYSQALPDNRAVLRRIVETKLTPLAARQRVAFWGAGRIFDALVKFGGLRSDQIYALLDRFLGGIVAEIHGLKVQAPDTLKRLEPDVVVVLGRSSEDAMVQEAHAHGVRHVIKFSDLFDQCR
jgi:hypothetical protein